jgi:hypothetical protein
LDNDMARPAVLALAVMAIALRLGKRIGWVNRPSRALPWLAGLTIAMVVVLVLGYMAWFLYSVMSYGTGPNDW